MDQICIHNRRSRSSPSSIHTQPNHIVAGSARWPKIGAKLEPLPRGQQNVKIRIKEALNCADADSEFSFHNGQCGCSSSSKGIGIAMAGNSDLQFIRGQTSARSHVDRCKLPAVCQFRRHRAHDCHSRAREAPKVALSAVKSKAALVASLSTTTSKLKSAYLRSESSRV